MRRRGNQIKMEHVLIGLLFALLLPLAYFLKGDDEQDASEMEAEVTYEEKMPEERTINNIGPQLSAEKERQNRRLDGFMYQFLELRNIE